MPTLTCPQCGQDYNDEELFCPHCGAAQIPQASKIELNRQQGEARQTPREAKIGCGIGLIVGVALFVAVRLWLPQSDGAGDIGLLFVPPVLGAVGGLLVQRWLRSRDSASRR